MDISTLTITEAHKLLTEKKLTVRELVDSAVLRAKESGDLNAYLELFDTEEQIVRAENMFADGTATALTGIPLAMKDNILIKGRKASAASKMLEHYEASYDAFVTKKLRDAGAIFIGRTNMDEFAMGGSTENSAFGPTKNPHDTTRVPGGSSGGSAAALAAHTALATLGSDTGGSIRQPAAFCGVVGLKPTYGTVSRSGLMAMASSLDQIGPFTKTVGDARILFSAIKGNDPLDSTSYPDDLVARNASTKNPKVIGVPFDFVRSKGVDPRVVENFEQSLKNLESAGYKIRDISMPSLAHGLSVYYIIMPAEVSSNLARFDGVRYGLHVDGENLLDDYMRTRGEGFGPEVRRRILLGTYVLSSGYYDAYYGRACAVREMLREEYVRAFADVDIIATPTAPSPAFALGEKSGDPLQMYLADIFTVPVNIAGLPAISVPSGFVEEGTARLPLGIQFIAPHFHEESLFLVGEDFEKNNN